MLKKKFINYHKTCKECSIWIQKPIQNLGIDVCQATDYRNFVNSTFDLSYQITQENWEEGF